MTDRRESHGVDPIHSLSERIAFVVQSIPSGKVAAYGQVAAIAGNPRAARQVVRTLKMWSGSRDLPWHRIVRAVATRSSGDYLKPRASCLVWTAGLT